MPKLAWKKTRSIAFPQKRATGASLVEGDLYVHTQPGSGGVQIEDRQGRKVAHVESDYVRIASGPRVVLGSREETWLHRVADQEWTLEATLTGQALDFDGSRLVTVENHSFGPDGRCTVRVHRLVPLQLELELQDQPLWYSAAVSDRHLVLFRQTEAHAYELTEGGATRVPFESLPDRGGTGTLALVGDVCCIDAPGSANDSVDVYRFADGRWTHRELIDHGKLKSAPYPVMRVADGFVIRRHEFALAIRPHDDGVETKALKSRQAYTLFSDGRELGVFSPGSAQLYSLGATEPPRQAPATAPRPGSSPIPAEWQERIDALLVHADAKDDIQRRDALAAFRAFVKEVADAWRSAPDAVAGWIEGCDLALEPFPSDLRDAHPDLNPAQPPYRLVRRTLVFPSRSEEIGRSAHARLAHVTGEDLRGKHVKAMLQNRDAWTKLQTLDLHRCRIGAGALQALAKVTLPRLERLDLFECAVSDAAVRALAKRGGAPRLAHLNLMAALSKKAQLSSETLEEMGKAWALRSLSLARVPCTEEGLVALFDGPTGESIVDLDLRWTSTGADVLSSLGRATKLRSLHVDEDLTLEGVDPMPSVTSLDLKESKPSTDRLEALRRVFPGLRHLRLVSESWSGTLEWGPLLKRLTTLELAGYSNDSSYRDAVATVASHELAARLCAFDPGDYRDLAEASQPLRHVHRGPFHARLWSGELGPARSDQASRAPFLRPRASFALTPYQPFGYPFQRPNPPIDG